MTRRADAFRTLRKNVGSRRVARLMCSWSAFLVAPVPKRTTLSLATRPIRESADARLWKAYKTLRRDRRRINRESPLRLLHDLRVACKSLRYLMELYAPLYDKRRAGKLVIELKQLQDNLGVIQDSDVQSATLLSFGAEIESTGNSVRIEQDTISELATQLTARALEARLRFDACFGKFDVRTNRLRVRKLCKPALAESR